MADTGKKSVKSFEEAHARLAGIITQLEQGDAALDESIRLFEEGAALAAHCQKLLDKAEQKVVKLIKNEQNALDEVPFEDEAP